MVSAYQILQDRRGGAQSNGVLPAVNQISSDVGANCVKDVPLKEHFPSGNDYAPKVRKPYTITKQREKWTEEEHKKFVEALKLHGRSWQRIEEHVGTKTAVQIRSHAQKFFSKVVRESSSSDKCSIKPVDIPPPRPKRKPMHPYPRKLIAPIITGTLDAEELRRSSSPNSSVSEEENQSPTSVLPALESEISGATDSNSPNGSLSPVSSGPGVNHGRSVMSEPNLLLEETFSVEDQVPLRLELFPEESALVKEGPAEGASTCSLKLFGKTVFVGGFGTSTMGTCQSLPLEMKERPVDASQGNSVPTEISSRDSEGSGPSLMRWDFHEGMQIPIFPQQKLVMAKANPPTVTAQTHNGDEQNGGSWTCSITRSVNTDVNGEKNWQLGTKKGCQLPFTKEENGRDRCRRGFVPYKRCLAERDSQSSVILSEEREDQRIRLCL